jgi:hypothetical protein
MAQPYNPQHSPIALKLREINQKYDAIKAEAFKQYSQTYFSQELIDEGEEILQDLRDFIRQIPYGPRTEHSQGLVDQERTTMAKLAHLRAEVDRLETEFDLARVTLDDRHQQELEAVAAEWTNSSHPLYEEYQQYLNGTWPGYHTAGRGKPASGHMARGEMWYKGLNRRY